VSSYPRIGGLGGPAGSDLLLKFAGLRIGPASAGCACPAFMRTRYSWSTVSTTAEPKMRLDSLVATSRCATDARVETRFRSCAGIRVH